MFDKYWDSGQVVCLAVVSALLVAVAIFLFRSIRRKGKRPWPVISVAVYEILLLLAFLFGTLTQVSSEGFGYLPLLAITTPWSWLSLWLLSSISSIDRIFSGIGLSETFLINFFLFVGLCGSVNSCLLFLLLRQRQRKQEEDDAWESARWNR